MAYQNKHTWWLSGPTDPRGWGCDSGECGAGFAGLRGLGQVSGTCADGTAPGMMGCDDGSTPACPSGYTFNGLQCTQQNLQIGNPLLPVGSTASIIPGVANQYVLIGGAALALFLLLGMKR